MELGGDTKVGKLDVAVDRDEHVGRLDVAVHLVRAVQVRQALQDAVHDDAHLLLGERAVHLPGGADLPANGVRKDGVGTGGVSTAADRAVWQ